MITQEEIKALAALYLAGRNKLLDTIINHKGVGTKTYYNTILRQLQKELKRLQEHSDTFIETAIPKEYRSALRETYSYFRRNHLRMRNPSVFASLHTDALYEISREMQYQISMGLASVGRQIERYVDTAMDEALRQAGLRQTGEKIASGATVQDMQKALIEQLQSEGFMTVQYGDEKNARQVPVDVYAAMVARSTTREAGNTARLNQLTANGYDLVQMSTHYPTCEICAPLQGRVYSISGDDKRFPPLSKAFGEYNNVHPNCRHVIAPWVESVRTLEEVEEAIKFSNQPFTDSRKQAEIDLYKEQQGNNRRLRNDLYQYERYKAVLGEDAPKSPMAFRRIKKADGEQWRFMQLDYRRRNDLALHPEKALPNASMATAADEKFTGYLFNKDNPDGQAKGVAFASRLGYNIGNWKALQSEILKRAPLYPARNNGFNEYGVELYEQFQILPGLKRKPANVKVGWGYKDGKTWLTTCMLEEVK